MYLNNGASGDNFGKPVALELILLAIKKKKVLELTTILEYFWILYYFRFVKG